MKCIEFAEQNIVIAKDQPEYLQMPAFVWGDHVICLWKLTWRERLHILFHGRIWHTIRNFRKPLQPQKLQIEYPFRQQN
jgi:hypothetical protein